jgi:hypothetical protein
MAAARYLCAECPAGHREAAREAGLPTGSRHEPAAAGANSQTESCATAAAASVQVVANITFTSVRSACWVFISRLLKKVYKRMQVAVRVGKGNYGQARNAESTAELSAHQQQVQNCCTS